MPTSATVVLLMQDNSNYCSTSISQISDDSEQIIGFYGEVAAKEISMA